MIVLLPAFAGRLLFNSAITMENDLYHSRMQQKLRIELQKYDSALHPHNFISSAFERNSCEKLMQDWANGNDIKSEYLAHRILGQLPRLLADPDSPADSFMQFSREISGMPPQAVFVIAESEQDCRWKLSKPFDPPENNGRLTEVLAEVWKFLEKRNSFFGKQSIPERYDNLSEFPELNKVIGLFHPIKCSYGSIIERYSYKARDTAYIAILPVPAAVTGKDNRYIIAAFCRSAFSPQFMLKKTTSDFSNVNFTHDTILTSERVLPSFREDKHQMTLVGQLPHEFARLLAGNKIPEGLQAAISISCPANSPGSGLKNSAIDLLIKITAILSLMFTVAVMLGRIGNLGTLNKLVRACFLTGILLPLTASIWLGICHDNSLKQLETEEMLDFMQQQLALTEQKILLQISRSVLFQNIFIERTGKLSPQKLRKINEVTKYVTSMPKDHSVLEVCERMGRRFYSYFYLHPEVDDSIIGMGAGQGQVAESLNPVFISPAQEILFQLGAYRNISSERSRVLLQRSQITQGLIEVAIDRKMLSRIFAEERAPVFNSMTTGREYITCGFWKDHKHAKTGILFMQSSRENWKSDIIELIEKNLMQTVFYRDGYEMSIRVFFPNAYRQRVLDSDTHDVSAKFAPENKTLWGAAQAMFQVSQTSRINNLDSEIPHLLCGQAILNGDSYLMAHAVPVPGRYQASGTAGYALLLLLAVFSSWYLAGGVAWVLLRSIPAFQASMQEMAQQNYRWQIELNSGDEFDRLANTFNHLGRQLYEKQQISQLVSRNVLDVINSGDDQMLRPGGSRVTATILFADIRGFTALTEKYLPQDIVTMLNDYFSLMAEQIESRGGIIDKLIGDAIQAVFYHHECENGAEAAVATGLAMREALAGFNRQRSQSGLFTMDNGVGISTGTVICGRVGSEHGKLDATLVGSLVGQAAHLEGLSKSGTSSKVFIDIATAGMLGQNMACKPVPAQNNVFEMF